MRKKLTYGVLAIILLLVLTNPTMRDFKENQGIVNDVMTYTTQTNKESNFLLFSVFATNHYLNNHDVRVKYIGILKNFWKIN